MSIISVAGPNTLRSKSAKGSYCMPQRKPNVINQIIGALQRKKCAYDDIVTAADKVVEDYIFSKNKLLRKACAAKEKRASIAATLLFAGAALALFVFFALI